MGVRTDNLYWVWLAGRLGIGSIEFQRLMLWFESPYEIYMADPSELALVEGVSQRTIDALADKNLEEAADITTFCAHQGITILPYSDPAYPNRLRLLRDPPVLLYVKGKLPDIDSKVSIAVVGTRRMSEYGRECAYRISYELGAAGAIVVSGMALGIDGVAACGAINGGGSTVAVLGCGIDILYPREHAKLSEHIMANGAVVTEYPPGTPPAGQSFPRRNRIISGLCQGTLVIEADLKSGAMITAKHASEQGRQIFAIPGNLGEENTAGTNLLIRDGAIVVINTEDILAEYTYLYGKSIDTIRLRSARKRYIYSADIFDYMQVSARVLRGENAKSNMPSAPAEAFRRAAKVASPVNFTADDYIAGKGGREAKKSPSAKPAAREKAGDNSADLLASLDDFHRRLFNEIPDDRAIPVDALARLGYSIGEIMSAMTLLEIKGLVSSLPGGLYIKR